MISIIVPIYNAERYLKACVDSLLAQTEKDIEVLLIDDSSTDSSASITQSYAAKDNRVRALSQPHAGQSVARNYGMSVSKGEYIAFVDADDQLENDWCERHLAAIKGVDYVQSGYKRVSPKIAVSKGQVPRHPWQFTSPCMRLYRRATVEKLRFAEGYIYEDVLFSADLWLSGAYCRLIPYSGYLYTLNPDSTTAHRHPADEQRALRTLRQKAHGQNLRKKVLLWYTILRLKLHFILQ